MPQAPVVLEDGDSLPRLPKGAAPVAMRQHFIGRGGKRALQPPQTLTLFPGGRGDFGTSAEASTGAQLFGAKLSPHLVARPKPLITV